MADENGANKRAVGNVLREDMRQKTRSCQWYFLQCAQKIFHRIDKEDCKDFMKLANSLVRNAFEEYHTKLETICICSNVKSWIDFWHKRRFHFVSAFRGFFLLGVNLAEVGQAGMKCQQNHRLLALVDAAHKDISAQMCQDELYGATIENCTSARGWAQIQADQHQAHTYPDTLLICKMAILGWRKQLSKISMNFILMRIPAMILTQHANFDMDVDVVAEEEELQALTSIKQTGHQEEIMLKLSHHITRQCNPNLRCKLSHHVTKQCNPNLRCKLSHHVTRQCNPNLRCKLSYHVTRQCNPNLRCKLSHHVTRQCNPWYHPRLKPKLYQPSNPKPKLYPPSSHTHMYG